MMMRPLTRAEVRSLDRMAVERLGLPTLVLMENAGRGAADVLARRAGCKGEVVVLCGPGNNGGDGGVLARHLDAWGFPARVLWCCADRSRLPADAAVQMDVLDRAGVRQEVWATPPDDLGATLAGADWIVDALLGTGLTRPVEGPLRAVIVAMNGSGKPVLALDVPSGLDTDTGRPLGAAVVATLTATFVAPKVGFAEEGAREFTGAVHVVDIGLPRSMLEPYRAR
jgi:NAD(P)H-hydrate epimerase